LAGGIEPRISEDLSSVKWLAEHVVDDAFDRAQRIVEPAGGYEGADAPTRMVL
jgi:hypothetical protein